VIDGTRDLGDLGKGKMDSPFWAATTIRGYIE
jgi:hypothetical protein